MITYYFLWFFYRIKLIFICYFLKFEYFFLVEIDKYIFVDLKKEKNFKGNFIPYRQRNFLFLLNENISTKDAIFY